MKSGLGKQWTKLTKAARNMLVRRKFRQWEGGHSFVTVICDTLCR